MKQKTSFIILVCIVLLTSACSKKNEYKITGSLKGMAPNGRALLLDPVTFKGDTVEIKNGQFTFSGKLDQPKLFRCMLATPENPPYEILKSSLIYVENGDLKIEGDFNSIESYYNFTDTTSNRIKLIGSASNDLYEKYLEQTRPYVNQAAALSASLAYDTVASFEKTAEQLQQAIAIQKKMAALQTKRDQIKEQFIKQYPSSQLAYDLVYASMAMNKKYEEQIDESIAKAAVYFESMSIPNSEKTEEWISLLNNSQQFTPEQIQQLKTMAIKCARLCSGAPFLDGDMITPKKDTVKLSSILKDREYTLIDFWASWCGPCRDLLPHIKQLHQKYADKGLNIISISCDDVKNMEKTWLKGLKEENMPWPQFLAEFDSKLTSGYNINSIPNIVLIDPEKRIVKTGIRGYDLDLILQDIYGE